MDAEKRKRLFELPQYRVLDAKRKKLISFHLLDGLSFSRACTMIGLNKTRESKRTEIADCLAAFNRASDPDGRAQLFERVRRLGILVEGRADSQPDPNFANQTFELEPKSFLFRELGIRELPVQPVSLPADQKARYEAYAEKYISAVPAAADWQCPCRPEATNRAGQYLCARCGRNNPDTIAKRASNPYDAPGRERLPV